jgi:hypothetical protein
MLSVCCGAGDIVDGMSACKQLAIAATASQGHAHTRSTGLRLIRHHVFCSWYPLGVASKNEPYGSG